MIYALFQFYLLFKGMEVVVISNSLCLAKLAQPHHGSDHQSSLCSILLIGCVKFCSRLYDFTLDEAPKLGPRLWCKQKGK